MPLYQLTAFPDQWNRYSIDGEHRWYLPAVECDVCGEVWVKFGESYPSVDLEGAPAICERLASNERASPDEWFELQRKLVSWVPRDAPLWPGASFGPFTGRAKGKSMDVLSPDPAMMLFHEEAIEGLRARGVMLPRLTPARLMVSEPKSRCHFDGFYEPESPPLVRLGPASFVPDRAPCRRCGFRSGNWGQPRVSNESELPAHCDLFRAREHPMVQFVTERFAHAAQELELSGISLSLVDSSS